MQNSLAAYTLVTSGTPRRPLQRFAASAFRFWAAALCFLWLTTAEPTQASELAANSNPSLDQLKFFESHVRPVLAKRCYECHGPDEQTSDLRVDSRAALLTGGESGPAVTPGNSSESLLIEAINYESFEMPPDGKLSAEEIAALTTWVKAGAAWPTTDAQPAAASTEDKISDEDRSYWFFQPLANPEVPPVSDSGWSRTSIDHFVYRRLQAQSLTPAPAAAPETLMRRLYFNLTGLPPTPEQIEAYLADTSADRYERLVDQLLDSPRYGERWGRFWLDLVRYAESDGWRQDAFRQHAYKYRDYVIRSFNQDKPYDQFITEQLAGDELAPGDIDALTATMYFRHGIYEYNQRDVATQWANILNEITDVTGDVFLGLGMGCARCHDHKFDPILRKDYYRLQAYFTPLLWREDQPLASLADRSEYESELAAWQQKTDAIRQQLDAVERPILLKSAGGQGFDKFAPELQAMMLKRPADRSPLEHQLAELSLRQLTLNRDKLPERLSDEQRPLWEQLQNELAVLNAEKPEALQTVAYVVSDVGNTAPPTRIPHRRSSPEIAPGILTVLDPEPAEIPALSATLNTTGRRTALARWMTKPDNPLTTRVIANRIWQYHFGQGLVATSSDFGRLGEPPSHPLLLDWLARRFVQDGWSFKRLHRLILNSSVYRQSSHHPLAEEAMQSDPDNRLLWHAPTRRLDAEQIRDAMLLVSGELDLKVGGPSVSHSVPRRTVYTKTIRNTRDPLLDAFDLADGFASASQRNVTTTPTQALLMINGPFGLARATAWARRLRATPYPDNNALVGAMYRRAFGRPPSEEDLAIAERFLDTASDRYEPPTAATEQLLMTALPHAGGEAIVLKPGSPQQRLVAEATSALPEQDFTIEAVVVLNSLYQDATVRTIAAHWDSNPQHPGWALGVTSEKSRYSPRNLILQLVGKTHEGQQTYEVIASDIHLSLDTPYYVAASVDIDDTSANGITFYVQNLAVANVPIQTASTTHKVVADYRSALQFAIGGRDMSNHHYWDGLIGEVRLSSTAIKQNQLFLDNDNDLPSTVGHWKFEAEPSMLADSSGNGYSLQLSDSQSSLPTDPRAAALIDLCHVLLNASEFLYVD